MLVLALAAAFAVATPPKPTAVAAPGQHFVLSTVPLRGKHWVVSSRCANAVKVTLRLPNKQTRFLKPARVNAKGRFATSWTPPRFSAGTVRLTATETCKGRVLIARSSFRVWATP